jgi:FkbM family methyltransferase
MRTRASEFLRYTQSIASVGRTPLARAKLWAAVLWLLLRDKFHWLPRVHIRLETERFGRPVRFVVADYQDLEVVRELYVEDEYALPLPNRAEVVVDAGANIGLSTLEFRARYPDARIIAIEPDPHAFAKLARATAGDPRISAIQVAVSANDESRTFYSSRESVVSGFEPTRPFQTAIRVRARSLSSLLDELAIDHVDLLKLDVEGAEREALEGVDPLERFGYIVGELHLATLGQEPEAFYAESLHGFEATTHARDAVRCTFTAAQP